MSEKLNRIYVTRPFLPPREEYEKYLDEIWANRILTNQGPLHQHFETELSEFFDGLNVTLVNNGHMALDVVLKTLGICGEVITTPFTFISTTHALMNNGIKPVFCDIRQDDLTMDPELIESLITNRTSAIMPVHVYGHPCDTQAISEVAKKYDLKVIYDAAHAFGLRYKGNSIVAYGDVSMLSFHATKLFNSIEGGALVCNDSGLKQKLDAYKNYGFQGERNIPYVGLNAKMNEFQAAMGLAVLPYVNDIIERRKAATLLYRELLKDVPGLRTFTPESNSDIEYNYAYMPVLIESEAFGATRDEVYDRLKSCDIYARRYFYPLTPHYTCYGGVFNSAVFPVAEKASSEVLCLPLWDSINAEQIEYVCTEIQKVGSKGA